MNKKVCFILGIIIGCLLGIGGTFLVMNFSENKNETVSSAKEKIVKEDSREAEEDVEVSFLEDIVDEGVFKVESLYCDLYYPIEWKEKIDIEEELNIVHFGTDIGGETVTLFDVVSVENSKEETISELEVHIVLYDLEFNEQWSEEEKQMVIEMQEDIGCIVDYLEKDGITVIM